MLSMENHYLFQNLFLMSTGNGGGSVPPAPSNEHKGAQASTSETNQTNQPLPPDALLHSYFMAHQNSEQLNMPILSNPFLDTGVQQQQEEPRETAVALPPIVDDRELLQHLLNQQREANIMSAPQVAQLGQLERQNSSSTMSSFDEDIAAASACAGAGAEESMLGGVNLKTDHSFNNLIAHQSDSTGSINLLNDESSMLGFGEAEKINSFLSPQNASWGNDFMSAVPPSQQPSPSEKTSSNMDTNAEAGMLGTTPSNSDPGAETSMLLGPWSAASAELLGDLALSNQEKSKKNRKKPKDKPKRPLSAYNIFFREERQRLLEEIPDIYGKHDDRGSLHTGSKKKPHGKIDFQSLAKIVGKRWQNLSAQEAQIYKHKADEDMQRYKKEMEAYVATELPKMEGEQEQEHEQEQETPI